MHESFAREPEAAGSSDRNFGLVMAGACAVFGALPLLRGHAPYWWLFGIGLVFLALALARPALLAPLNRLWTRLGLLLHRIVSPLMLGLMFYGAIMPFGLVMRVFGRDPLRRKREPGAASYWIERTPPGPEPKSMRQQF